MGCTNIAVWLSMFALWISTDASLYQPTNNVAPSAKVDTGANMLWYGSGRRNGPREVIPPYLLPKPRQNCTGLNQVYVSNGCLPQIALHGTCRYTEQCSSLVPSSICESKSDTENFKTCQCPLSHIPSGRSTSCIPKRNCQPDSMSTVQYGFNSVEPERGSCRPNEICMKGHDICICSKNYEMDNEGNCIQLEPFNGISKNENNIDNNKVPVHKVHKDLDKECKVVLQQVRKAIESKYNEDLEKLVEIRVKEALKNANSEFDQTIKYSVEACIVFALLLSAVSFYAGYIYSGYRRNDNWRRRNAAIANGQHSETLGMLPLTNIATM